MSPSKDIILWNNNENSNVCTHTNGKQVLIIKYVPNI